MAVGCERSPLYEYPVSSGNWWTRGDYISGAIAGNYLNNANNDPYAWGDFNSGNVTHDVATKTANALGFYDMAGNANEWNFTKVVDGDFIYPTCMSGMYRFDGMFMQVGYWIATDSYATADYFGLRICRTVDGSP